MKKALYLLLAIFIITSCTTNEELKNSKEVKLITTKKSIYSKPKNTKKVLRRKKQKFGIKEPTKPIEVERICFDKLGNAHNCNYKINKPYL